MLEFNIFRDSLQEPLQEGQYKKLAWLFWTTMDNWMYARKISGGDHLNEGDFLQDLWSLMIPYFTEEGHQEFKLLYENTSMQFSNPPKFE